ncbi:MAG: VTT domain-containing protein [Acidobacteriota bacterium]
MHRLVAWVRGVALTLGGPGLFLIAFLDSSFLSFPMVVDVLLMGLVIRHKERLLYYALLPTLGSIAGCVVLFVIARKGGEAFLRRRFAGHHIDRALGLFRRYGLLAVAVPAIAPPPVPFKIFVLAAGVAGVKPRDFVFAIAVGRGFRYFTEALLAAWYGERAIAFVTNNARSAGLAIGAAIVVAVVVWLWLQRRRKTASAPPEPSSPI